MKIITLQTGDLFVNCYIVFKPEIGKAIVLDPGGSEEKIIHQIENHKLEVTHILLTHGHFDHIGALRAIKDKTGALVCIHEADAAMLTNPYLNLSVMIQDGMVQVPADKILKDKDHIQSGGMDFAVLHTPGHSEGSVCYIAEDALFSGDTLFNMSVGRSDFPGSDEKKLKNSINIVLKSLSVDYRVYPGHGAASTLDWEKQNNPFFEGE
jgi:glyoxylase-like metal-dependent hydrolase (beta-lactamase superfamily II)